MSDESVSGHNQIEDELQDEPIDIAQSSSDELETGNEHPNKSPCKIEQQNAKRMPNMRIFDEAKVGQPMNK